MRRLLNWLFSREKMSELEPVSEQDVRDIVIPELGMSANSYKQALDSSWQNYLNWRDSQVCVNCGRAFTDPEVKTWITETQCGDCYNKHGPAGKTRADYLAETGNQYL